MKSQTTGERPQDQKETRRRKYDKPVLEKVKIERDLSLRMATCACNSPSPSSSNCW